MFEQAKEIINKSNTIYVVGHINPDGDAIGSSFAIYFALKNFDNLLSEKKNTKGVKTSSKSTSSRSAKKIDTEKTQSEKVQVEKKQIVKKQKEPPKAKTSKKAKKPGKHYKQEGW